MPSKRWYLVNDVDTWPDALFLYDDAEKEPMNMSFGETLGYITDILQASDSEDVQIKQKLKKFKVDVDSILEVS